MCGSSPSSASEWDAYFDAFYLRAYADHVPAAETERQALAAVTLAGCRPPASVLDVPAGYGRIAVPLARAGYEVTAVDRSRPLLDEARRRAGDGQSPRLVAADYRELPFADESFDVALNLFTSIGYLGPDGDACALAEIRRTLRPGGRLVLEAMHRDLLARRFQERDWRPLADGRYLLERHSFDARSSIATTTQTLISEEEAAETRSFSVRVYTATELLAMIAEVGFEDAACYGGLDGSAFSTDTRLVVLARR